MWIRSQDRKKLIKIEGRLHVSYINEHLNDAQLKILNTKKGWGIQENGITLGFYLTEEKAIKVLDMIEKHINKVEEFKTQGENIQENYLGYGNSKARLMGFTFQMPQDSEVE